MKKIISIFFILFITINAVNATDRIYNIESFGAVGDGKTLNTKAIQQAIDSCSRNGGKVYIPKGQFMTASLELKDNIVIYVDQQGILLGSPELGDYPLRSSTSKRALLYGYNVKNITISGPGEINGNGGSRNFYHDDPLNGIQGGLRPFLFSINKSENINFRDITIKNGAFWNIALEKCNHVSVDGIKIFSRIVANNDGLDLTDCENVIVSNSYIDTGDDGICLKNHSTDGVKFVTITNCIIKSESNCIKFGTASVGGFEDITISNCVFYDSRLSGLAFEIVDGGIMDRVTVSNITMHNVNGSIFLKVGSRNAAHLHNMTDTIKAAQTGIMRNVMFSNIVADGIGCWKEDPSAHFFKTRHDSRIGMVIVGQPDFPVENVTFSNIYLQFAGGGTKEDASKPLVDQRPDGYPEYINLGVTAAYGINCLNARGLVFDNVKVDYIDHDARPAFCFQNVQDVFLDNIQAKISDESPAIIRFTDTENIFVTNCKPVGNVPFIQFGEGVKDASITGNDFSKIKTPFEKDKSIKNSEIKSLYNL